jgi:hypothetical protein
VSGPTAAGVLAACEVGTTLPALDVVLDRSTVVATAIASQDFEDVHHDPARAAERGTPDIFLSINATNGFLDRYVTDWAGPAARVTRVSLRLGVPTFPGDTLHLTGEVGAVDGAAVTVEVVGTHARGVHVRAQLTLTAAGEDPR